MSFFILPQTQCQTSNETILWWQRGYELEISLSELTSWALSNDFTGIAIYGYMSIAEIDAMQQAGLDVYNIWIAEQTANPLKNWTTEWTDYKDYTVAYDYDGVVIDDTQNIWLAAHDNGTVDDFTYYQWFVSNASIVSDVIGKEHTIIEMYIGGDNTDFPEMTALDCPDATFSYYYEPDSCIREFGSNHYYNMSTSAWDMVTHYDTFGLNTYFAYQGWLWFYDNYATPALTTYSLIATYNAIIDLMGNYTVTQLMVYNVANLYRNERLEPFLKEINDAFLDSEKLDYQKITLQDYNSLFWTENWNYLRNQSSITSENWQIIKQVEDYNYNKTTYQGETSLFIDFNGTNSLGYYGISFERLAQIAEMGIHIQVEVTPYNCSSWKRFILTSAYPHPHSYQIEFGYGTSYPLKITYINNSYSQTYVTLGKWTSGSKYTLDYYLNETYIQIDVSNSTENFSWNLTQTDLRYNSLKSYSFLIWDLTGNWGTPQAFTSCKIGNIIFESWGRKWLILTEYNNAEVRGVIYEDTQVYLYNALDKKPYETSENLTFINPYRTAKFNGTVGEFYIMWRLPNFIDEYIMLGIGLGGIFLLVFSPTWVAWKIRKSGLEVETVERFGYAMLLFLIGFGLLVVWLWR